MFFLSEKNCSLNFFSGTFGIINRLQHGCSSHTGIYSSHMIDAYINDRIPLAGGLVGETLKFACRIVSQFYNLRDCPARIFMQENINIVPALK